MKYKLINAETGEKHLCEKVVIDGFDYYVSGEIQIATNNPNIDIPKVVGIQEVGAYAFLVGYNKSKEAEFYSDSDMIEFAKYLSSQMDEDGLILNPKYIENRQLFVTEKQLLEIWKEQQPQTIYFK